MPNYPATRYAAALEAICEHFVGGNHNAHLLLRRDGSGELVIDSNAWITFKDEAEFIQGWNRLCQREGHCVHCGRSADGAYVCDACYASYSPAMLSDLEG